MTTAVHVFYGVFMGWSHASLKEIMRNSAGKDRLEKGEVAVFLNKSWTACKILGPGDVLLYYRSNAPIPIEAIRYLPTVFGGSRLGFGKNLEAHVIKTFESRFGVQTKRLKLAYA